MVADCGDVNKSSKARPSGSPFPVGALKGDNGDGGGGIDGGDDSGHCGGSSDGEHEHVDCGDGKGSGSDSSGGEDESGDESVDCLIVCRLLLMPSRHLTRAGERRGREEAGW